LRETKADWFKYKIKWEANGKEKKLKQIGKVVQLREKKAIHIKNKISRNRRKKNKI